MKYEAKIENGIVANTIVCDDNFKNPFDGFWVEYLKTDQVSVGDTYSETEGFRSPKPFDNWIWNDIEKYWDSPKPDYDNIYE